jgi:hypothetical protein
MSTDTLGETSVRCSMSDEMGPSAHRLPIHDRMFGSSLFPGSHALLLTCRVKAARFMKCASRVSFLTSHDLPCTSQVPVCLHAARLESAPCDCSHIGLRFPSTRMCISAFQYPVANPNACPHMVFVVKLYGYPFWPRVFASSYCRLARTRETRCTAS